MYCGGAKTSVGTPPTHVLRGGKDECRNTSYTCTEGVYGHVYRNTSYTCTEGVYGHV